MDFNRRRFLTGGGLTLGLGGAFTAAEGRAAPADAVQPISDYERIFAESAHLAWLGLPRRWESVRQGFHPFSPERIGILPNGAGWGLPSLENAAKRMQELLADRPPDVSDSFWSSDDFRLYIEVSELLCAYYPDMPLENWLRALVVGEQFYGFAFEGVKTLHSLESPSANTPQVVSPPADWWLFLLREPLRLYTFDDRPVRIVVGQVHCAGSRPSPFRRQVGYLCQEWQRSLRDHGRDFLDHVATLDRVSAARLMNLEISKVLEQLKERKR